MRKQKLSSRRANPKQPLYWISADHVLRSEDIFVSGFDTIDIAAIYEAGFGHENQEFDFNLYASLLPIPVEEWCPENNEHRHPAFFSSNYPLRDVLQFVPKSFTRLDLLEFLAEEWIQKSLFNTDLDRFNDPVEIVRTGFLMLREAREKFGKHSPEFAKTLLLIGCGSYQFTASKQCELCFRRIAISEKRCNEHTQSKFVRTDIRQEAAKQSQRARIGRKTAKRIRHAFVENDARLPNLEPGNMAGIFWNGTNHPEMQATILAALESAPLVRKRLPKNFNTLIFSEQLDVLRAKLDPLQWDVNSWVQTITNAQMWFETEKLIAPGSPPKGMREKSKKLAEEATFHLARGVSQKDVATRLGMSESGLSHLLKRYRN